MSDHGTLSADYSGLSPGDEIEIRGGWRPWWKRAWHWVWVHVFRQRIKWPRYRVVTIESHYPDGTSTLALDKPLPSAPDGEMVIR